ncbi:hypothetical protein [Methanosphaera cuniculi]|uniref:Uncharacterized protein n=1 Tax=Methanosphaera cuniculi TaxID=1077256 RepID=A0A2A2HE89_9EURY|nr:hypothetical protein [Methanosphaera cuniculi]PAV07742.1 hypothetical protein ASJ82_01010 [Methanosphaera cuniculi]PWL08459.1 hypothetical protein MSCUN_06530 [Methanosphaera cuniculi]
MTEELKLVQKCYDPEEYGYLYGFNREIPDFELEDVKQYMKKFTPASFKNVMAISGDPHGWMCTEENVPKVEETLSIQDTLAKRQKQQEQKRKDAQEIRKQKEEAMNEIEKIFKDAPRPPQKLEILIKASKAVYDPANSFRDNKFYGAGQLFIITEKSIWYIINNSSEGNNRKINNIEINDIYSAIGFRVDYTEDIEKLIKIVSENNLYKEKNRMGELKNL